jgi:hypothetical protein
MEKETPTITPGQPAQTSVQKWLHRIKYILLGSLLVLVCQAAIAYWLLSSRWEMYVPEEKMIRFATQVSLAQPLPDNFKNV